MGHKVTMEIVEGALSRTQFIAAGAVAASAAVAAGVAIGPVEDTDAQTDKDVEALQLILLLEYTETAFYAEALDRGGLSGEVQGYAEAVLDQEREHLAFIRKALGGKAGEPPRFEFGAATRDPDAFASTAAELEDLAVAAYNGQATNVSKPTLEAAATVVSVEARHAAWIRSIAGEPPAPDATDTPLSAPQVRQGLERIGLRS
jgi:rubrerythrin